VIHKITVPGPMNGTYVIGSGGRWLPGTYDSAATAYEALQLPTKDLERLKEAINDGEQRAITNADISHATIPRSFRRWLASHLSKKENLMQEVINSFEHFDQVVATYTRYAESANVRYDGYLKDGRAFFFSSLFGKFSLGFGHTPREAVNDRSAISLPISDLRVVGEPEFKRVFMALLFLYDLYEHITPPLPRQVS
jgi:hypothetical protein